MKKGEQGSRKERHLRLRVFASLIGGFEVRRDEMRRWVLGVESAWLDVEEGV